MFKIFRAVISAFTDYSPTREKRKRLERAEMELVVAKHDLELLQAHVPMLEGRVKRLKCELADDEAEKQVRIHTHIQRPASAQTFHPSFNFRRRAAQ
jgi:hypothetical protein